MDGNREVAKVTATDTGEITVDKLVFAHESSSTIVKLEIDDRFKRLLKVITSIGLVSRIVGQSYTDITGYTLGEYQVQKGEPYTQWRETAIQLIRERDDIMSRLSVRPYIQ